MMSELKGKRILVLGAGVSGLSAASFALKMGGSVTLADDATLDKIAQKTAELASRGVVIVAGGMDKAGTSFDLAVVSPGISVDDARIKALKAQGVEVVGEIELASRFINTPVIAVTGSNGKTTTTNLIGEVLRKAGKKVFVGGNIGTPLVDAVGKDLDFIVCEVSSFQLETCNTFKPKVGVWLNLTGNHLDRHGDMQTYAWAKAQLFANQSEGDYAVLNREDEWVWGNAKSIKACILPYSSKRVLGVGSWLLGDELIVLMPGNDGERLPIGAMKLPGLHNLENAMAVLLGTCAVGVPATLAMEVIRNYEGLPHRIQTFMNWNGIRFVDDSKSTSVDASKRAIETVGGPTIWMAGGKEKGSDYLPLREVLSANAKEIILVGASTQRMQSDLAGSAPITLAADWPTAVKLAFGSAKPGDTVLLSPAAASFDFFTGYAQRGDVFQSLCREEAQRRADGK